ncbi:hypothetical protein Celaphus_00018547 [Cervus elaphus hippelaphus]|uniref:Uncharacterized protein n=1 Tax=Cervus elaphus hippelaphus TaxID=46360 RepID=A0A212CLM4_CEREH|nr:hypothetical protein Celaphus_00018547 [Cervus elaphus hippelaphus]
MHQPHQLQREMLERMAPKVTQAKRVTLDRLLQELSTFQEQRIKEHSVLGIRHGVKFSFPALFTGKAKGKPDLANVGRQGLLDEGTEGILEPLDQRVPLDHLDLKDYKGQRESQDPRESQELMESRDPMDFLDQRVQMALWDPMALQVPKEKEVKKELWESRDPEGRTNPSPR